MDKELKDLLCRLRESLKEERDFNDIGVDISGILDRNSKISGDLVIIIKEMCEEFSKYDNKAFHYMAILYEQIIFIKTDPKENIKYNKEVINTLFDYADKVYKSTCENERSEYKEYYGTFCEAYNKYKNKQSRNIVSYQNDEGDRKWIFITIKICVVVVVAVMVFSMGCFVGDTIARKKNLYQGENYWKAKYEKLNEEFKELEKLLPSPTPEVTNVAESPIPSESIIIGDELSSEEPYPTVTPEPFDEDEETLLPTVTPESTEINSIQVNGEEEDETDIELNSSYTLTEGIFLRSSTDIDSNNIITQMHSGSSVLPLEYIGDGWYKVQYNSEDGIKEGYAKLGILNKTE